MEFILGCNYWASNAGADMWRDFDVDAIRADLDALSHYGVRYMRVFPNWRDFQPIMPLYGGRGALAEYCLEGERTPENEYYLDEGVMARFSTFLDLCDEYGIRLIVGLVTGWMSGRLYVPTALYGKNVLTDPTALWFEQLFIRGFVTRFKDRDAIYAWDLGNECNCMADANHAEAVNWTATVANAIRSADPTRPVVSGMHGLALDPDSPWQIRDQAAWTDILTTHPYPYWNMHTRNDLTLSARTLLFPTAQGKLYAECGGRPCLCEEIGTMGPMLASDDAAANFLRVNLFSLLANGQAGVMWWCAHEQSMLTAFPYSHNMVEKELGLLLPDRSPKAVATVLRDFSDLLTSTSLDLPAASTDAVCLLSHGQDGWGVAYTTYLLARRAGINIRFAYADDGIPDSPVYMLPSVNGIRVMHSRHYDTLRERVRRGATLYLSLDNVALSEFEGLTGMRPLDSYESASVGSFALNGTEYTYATARRFLMQSVGATVLATASDGYPILSEYKYGEGRVILLSYPLEANLINGHNRLDGNEHTLYSAIFRGLIASHPVTVTGDGVYTTVHGSGEMIYTVSINCTPTARSIRIDSDDYRISRVISGAADSVDAYNATVIEYKKTV